jgi:hypothetical protein
MSKGRYSIVNDDTGQKFLDYPEGGGYEPGHERKLDESVFH